MNIAFTVGMMLSFAVDPIPIVFAVIAYQIGKNKKLAIQLVVALAFAVFFTVISVWLANLAGTANHVSAAMLAFLSFIAFLVDYVAIYGIAYLRGRMKAKQIDTATTKK